MINKIAPYLLYIFIKILQWTLKIKYYNREILENIKKQKKLYVVGVWHQNLFNLFSARFYQPHICLVSSSKDGDIIAKLFKLMDYKVPRGSSTRDGKTGMESMIEMLQKDNLPGGMAVDGPLGPPKIPKRGIFKMAQKSDRFVIPIMAVASKYWELQSWDKFRIPKPFSTINIYYGEPFQIPKNSPNLDTFIEVFQTSMANSIKKK